MTILDIYSGVLNIEGLSYNQPLVFYSFSNSCFVVSFLFKIQ